MTTSLTVTPNALRTCLISSSGSETNAKRRCADSGPLNGVRGAGSTGSSGTRPLPARRRARLETVAAPGSQEMTGISSRCGMAWAAKRTAWAGLPASLVRPRTSMPAGPGGGGSCSGSPSGGGAGSGVRSSSAASTSAPPTPSTAAWWIFV